MSFKNFDSVCSEINVGSAGCKDPILASGSGVREAVVPVVFKIPFTGIPTEFSLGLRHIQASNNSDLNYLLIPSDVTKTGMNVRIQYGLTFKGSSCIVDYTAVYYRKVAANPMINPMTKFFGKRVYIRNLTQDAYLRNNNGVIDLSASKKKLEVWIVEDGGNGTVNFYNEQFKKYMNSDSTDGSLGHQVKSPAISNKSIAFTATELSTPDTFTFADSSNKNIQGHDSFDCDTNQTVPNDDQFEIIII